MKALTIWQPWASLIMMGAKPWEWRGWPMPNWMRLRPCVIHAGARPVRPAEIAELIEDLHHGDTSLKGDIALPFLRNTARASYPLSAGLGTVIFGTPIPAAEWAAIHDKPGLDSDRIDHSKWAWPVTDIKPFFQPIPCRGAQGFWNWPEAGIEPFNAPR